jgi:hypothetical protein
MDRVALEPAGAAPMETHSLGDLDYKSGKNSEKPLLIKCEFDPIGDKPAKVSKTM